MIKAPDIKGGEHLARDYQMLRNVLNVVQQCGKGASAACNEVKGSKKTNQIT